MPLISSSSSAIDDQGDNVVSIDRTTLSGDLINNDVNVRRDAVRLAGRLGEAELLARHFGEESDLGVREMILTSLVRMGGAAAARPLIELLHSDDAVLRNAVIETLQSMGDAIVPDIEVLVHDENPDLRIYAVNILLSLRSPRVPDIALRVIENDPHVNVCVAAVDVLAELGRPNMAEALRTLANRFPDQPFLAFAVRAAVKRIV